MQLPGIQLSAKKSGLRIKYFYFFIGFIVLLELIAGIYYLTRPVADFAIIQDTTTRVNSENNLSQEASIVLEPTGPVKLNQELSINIVLQTKEPTDGVDVILTYDPAFFALVPASVDTAVSLGSLFQDYPSNSLAGSGRVSFSAVVKPDEKGFFGKGVLGNVKFKALKRGPTEVGLEFTPGSTSDSNIISSENGSDILQSVGNAKIVIE